MTFSDNRVPLIFLAENNASEDRQRSVVDSRRTGIWSFLDHSMEKILDEKAKSIPKQIILLAPEAFIPEISVKNPG